MPSDPPPSAQAALRAAFRDAEPLDAREDWFDLTDPDAIWLVEQGTVDVFMAHYRDGMIDSPFIHALRVAAGGLLFAPPPMESGELRLRARASSGSALRRASRSVVRKPVAPPVADAVAASADAWVEALSRLVVAQTPVTVNPDRRAVHGETIALAADERLAARRGVIWVHCAGGPPNWLDIEPGDPVLPTPLSPGSWLSLLADDEVRASATGQLLAEGTLFEALDAFHRMAFRKHALNLMYAKVDRANLQRSRALLRRRRTDRAQAELAMVSRRPSQSEQAPESALQVALTAIGQCEGIRFQMAKPRPQEQAPRLEDTLMASGLRARPVSLAAKAQWWRQDHGALLASRAADGQPVALIPVLPRGYRMVTAEPAAEGDRLDKSAAPVNAERAATLADAAWTFTRPLPEQTGALDIVRVALRKTVPDLARFFVAGLLASLVAFAPAFVIRALVERGFPEQDTGLLWLSMAGLGMVAVLGLLLGLYQATALLRIEGRMAVTTTSALWDRLLNLPADALGALTAGELEQRAMAFHTMRDKLVGIVARVTLSAVFLMPTFAVMFHFNVALAWTAMVCGALAFAAAATLAMLQRGPHRRGLAAMRGLSGNLFQFVNGIAKLRTSNAEPLAFAFWAHAYSERKRAEIATAKLSDRTAGLSATTPILTTAAFFFVAMLLGNALTVGDFVAAYAATMVFLGAVGEFGTAVEAIMRAAPELRQIEPILKAQPEPIPAESSANVELRGALRLEQVSLERPDAKAPVLENISLHAEPGEFIAIVGESGAGKSSLIRLALGLEPPSTGSVYYDGRDLAFLNLRSVRQQIGVVTQNAMLQPGTVLSNIIGVADDLDVEDAWQAAEAAALADTIRTMPMGIHTVVSSNSAFFSGGQMQRIHIARALVRNPPILLLDEPTSWLDHASQAKVMESLTGLAATRVIIAHRISTIRDADRIYVLQGGRLVQSGTYDDLAEVEGAFRRLIGRQLASG